MKEEFREALKNYCLYILAVVLGVASIIVPAMILGGNAFTHPVFPAARNGIENYSWHTVAFQLLGGALLGALNPLKPWRWGVAMGVAWPFLAVLLMITESADSNFIWPVAIIIYSILTVPCVGGAFVGAYIRKRFDKGKQKTIKFDD